VFGLAATDHDSHIEIMAELAEFLTDSNKINSLLTCDNIGQIQALLA
jgi:mannitol/fructose-specific phosphotransferase system IIA component (Ntr-type)